MTDCIPNATGESRIEQTPATGSPDKRLAKYEALTVFFRIRLQFDRRVFVNRIFFLQNPIMYYAWGSKTAISRLLGRDHPAEQPQAELWMGAHPKAPSTVRWEGRDVSLAELIADHPIQLLGAGTVERFGARLPYLFKVLAAAAPLSIQAHPNREQASLGFERENAAGIPLDAPHRNYRDDNHKPECICAVTHFWALNGFRRIDDMLGYFQRLEPSCLDDELTMLKGGNLKGFFESIMTLTPDCKRRVTSEIRDLAGSEEADDPVFRWITSLSRAYPGDIGILAPILLNLVCLQPGEAMYLSAGELHAYLEGTGIELMANSDNVLRGGLTPKHVDLPELLKVLTFDPRRLEILHPVPVGESESRYPCPVEEFVLSVIEVAEGRPHHSRQDRSVEILLCTAGSVTVVEDEDRQTAVKKGVSFLVPASAPAYRIVGTGTLYKAAVPLSYLN
jgi:mannose-6-phosphate isomerase